MFRFPALAFAAVVAAICAPPPAAEACPPVAVSVHGGFVQQGFAHSGFVAVPQASFFVPQASFVASPHVFAQPLFFGPSAVVVRGRARNSVVVQAAPGVVQVQVAPQRVRVRRGLFGGTTIRVR